MLSCCPKGTHIWSCFIKLDMLMARRHPKSPWSLSGTSTNLHHGHSHTISCLQAIEGEDTDNPLICQIINCLWALSDKGTHVGFCWVPSHCGIEGNEIVDQLAKETLDHDIKPLTTVHFADLKPLVNSYIQQEVQIKWDVSIHGRDLYLLKPTLGPPKRFRHLTRAEEVVITWLPNWPYQDHKIPYLVLRTTNCLPALWPDSDNWAHTPGMYSVATKSWWVLHSWLIEDPLWDDPRGLHNRISERSWILLSDMNGHISNTTLYSNQSPTDIIKLN